MQKLLSILADTCPHSLQKLTALLQLQELALLEKVNELNHIGLNIKQFDSNLQLIPSLPLLDLNRLHEGLPYHIILQPVIDSTNQYILEHIHQFQKGDLCLAEHQTNGRGRRGRQWLSPFAGQIILSFYWTLPPQTNLNGLSLVIGLSLVEALKQAGIKGKLEVKWPNDVLLNGKKLAGILVEIVNLKNGLLDLVIGIGMNGVLPMQSQFSSSWAALSEVFDSVDRTALIIDCITHLYARLDRFEQVGIDNEFRQKWFENDAFLGQEVNVIMDQKVISGIEQGIDERGYLQLMTTSEMLYFSGGEVSLRKKCG